MELVGSGWRSHGLGEKPLYKEEGAKHMEMSPRPIGTPSDPSLKEFTNIVVEEKYSGLLGCIDQLMRMKSKMLHMRECHKVAAKYYTTFYYSLTVPSLCFSVLTSTAASMFSDGSSYRVVVTIIGAVNSILLSLVAFLKLQSVMDQHKQAVELYDDMFTEFEFDQEIALVSRAETDKDTCELVLTRLAEARSRILKIKQECPALPSWAHSRANNADLLEGVPPEVFKKQREEMLEPIRRRLHMEDTKMCEEGDDAIDHEVSRLIGEGQEVFQNLHSPSEEIQAKKVNVVSKIMVTVTKAQKQWEGTSKSRLSNSQYDTLMTLYAFLNGIDREGLEKHTMEFAHKALLFTAQALAYKLKGRSETIEGFVSNNVLDVPDKSGVQETIMNGEELMGKLKRIRNSSILKTASTALEMQYLSHLREAVPFLTQIRDSMKFEPFQDVVYHQKDQHEVIHAEMIAICYFLMAKYYNNETDPGCEDLRRKIDDFMQDSSFSGEPEHTGMREMHGFMRDLEATTDPLSLFVKMCKSRSAFAPLFRTLSIQTVVTTSRAASMIRKSAGRKSDKYKETGSPEPAADGEFHNPLPGQSG